MFKMAGWYTLWNIGIMKPFGREKTVKGGTSRSIMKQKLKKEIDEDLIQR